MGAPSELVTEQGAFVWRGRSTVIRIPGHATCLAHLTGTDRDTYLAGLTPGADIDHRGTPFTEDLLNRLLTALRDPTPQRPCLGDARFSEAQFSGRARFGGAQFSEAAGFNRAQYSGRAEFGRALCPVVSWWGPVVCAGVLDLSRAVFGAPVTLEIAAREVRCTRTRRESTATARIRHASVDLGYAALADPVAVTAHPAPFTTADAHVVDESLLAGPATVRVASVQAWTPPCWS
ncbi:pentapeptide repeat-containing protein [Streptomyces actuosus]|uniref:Pentapeptide repeat-containing protein n=1 Tax=Streptomyces actuosus TaxID=1885 RepID=A0ABS2VZV8_STRAS|nr:pentapeptide repeat-containing protein [Streptomyces actuosus]MBN0048516.1 pentapeptide repeat-containing protein [Streptomyces actuosus]